MKAALAMLAVLCVVQHSQPTNTKQGLQWAS